MKLNILSSDVSTCAIIYEHQEIPSVDIVLRNNIVVLLVELHFQLCCKYAQTLLLDCYVRPKLPSAVARAPLL